VSIIEIRIQFASSVEIYYGDSNFVRLQLAAVGDARRGDIRSALDPANEELGSASRAEISA